MTKETILDRFRDINEAYNDSSRLDSLSKMIDELLDGREEIVRCMDCKQWAKSEISGAFFCPLNDLYTTGDWFCADGEART